MYIYELPPEINKELCRLLDNFDYWEELAGNYMMYTAMDVIEIKEKARHQGISPTEYLLECWGQKNHRIEELFVLLYRMKHIPAMRRLTGVVHERFHRLLHKLEAGNGQDGNNARTGGAQRATTSSDSVPLPVILFDQGIRQAPSSSGLNGRSPSADTSSATSTSTDTSSAQYDKYDEILRKVSAIPKMSYEELRLATDDWSERNLLGRGGFGQVYKGEWKLLGVAVKRLRDNEGRDQELVREMCLNQYRHDNILPLYGYSLGGPEACLVYQLMAGGSLEQRLRPKDGAAPLSWAQRCRIMCGVARGLQFLHTMTGSALIHGDIKPANILLDQCLEPKIGDFGLARKGPYGDERTHLKVSRVYGTRPYLPDEYLQSCVLSPAVDVYSFGVVVAETSTGLPAWDRSRARPLLAHQLHSWHAARHDLGALHDPRLPPHPALCRALLELALHCTQPPREARPPMLLVYRRLHALAAC
ncbi:serine/threonine-protein kinase pelle [Bombyx mori]|uniref:non-specific serine/threonine protein kinase n=1 Tax=Bombyx mori TaxID=7091 RepID=A0A8R2R4M8_BOMMO|nr:serine/threonine-protein kinase pelle [Bombyx mori]